MYTTSRTRHRRTACACRGLIAACGTAAALQLPSLAQAASTATEAPAQPLIISSDIDPNTGYYSIINIQTGADRFYDNGYFGSNTVIANVEAGYVWNGHETTMNVNSYVSNSPLNATAPQYDYHATMVGFTMVGLGPLTAQGYYYYQFGMAPAAELSSVAIATAFGPNGSFDITSSTFVYGYKTAMQDGIPNEVLPGITVYHTADVINSSFGYEDPAGNAQGTMIIDALAFVHHQTVCVAAGNHDSGTARVTGPASGFNTIAVGALTSDLSDPRYGYVADFSNTGPNDFYNPQTGETIHGVRAAVSISAPGTDLILPAYVGATGSNMSGTMFDTTGIPPDQFNQLYFQGVAGTSFASPVVAGGAALVVDAGYANFGGGHAVDGRVVKAVLLNSADKIAGWTNNTTLINGVLHTSQGLDWNSGAGALDLNRAYDQYLSGTTDVPGSGGGTVHTLGWDFGHVTAASANDYQFDTPLHAGDTVTATLDWFINQFFNSDATADPDTDSFSDADLHATYFDQLDLQVWEMQDGQPTTLIADSSSPYNNVDHLYFAVPDDGIYAIRVSFLGTTYDIDNSSPLADDYALAWSVTPVPEPGSLAAMAGAAALLIRRKRMKPLSH